MAQHDLTPSALPCRPESSDRDVSGEQEEEKDPVCIEQALVQTKSTNTADQLRLGKKIKRSFSSFSSYVDPSVQQYVYTHTVNYSHTRCSDATLLDSYQPASQPASQPPLFFAVHAAY